MDAVHRFSVVAVVLASLLLVPFTTGSAAASETRLETVAANGSVAVSIVTGVPRVGDRTAIRAYRDSGHFAQDRAAVIAAARSALESGARSECPGGPSECRLKRLAVVVDIDDTLVDWYPTYARTGFEPSHSERQAAVRSCATPVIAPARSLLLAAKRLGLSVVLLSGRRDPARAATRSCLERLDITGWDALILRNARQDRMSAASYKLQAFERISESGWTVVLSMGDQDADMVGTATTARFLLPNPLYRSR